MTLCARVYSLVDCDDSPYLLSVVKVCLNTRGPQVCVAVLHITPSVLHCDWYVDVEDLCTTTIVYIVDLTIVHVITSTLSPDTVWCSMRRKTIS